MTTTAKRQRQREGRVARMEAERRAAQRAARRRRAITAVVVAALVGGALVLVSALGGDDKGDEGSATTTTAGPTTTAPEKPDVTIPDTPAPTTLQSTDITVGDGPEAKPGDTVQVRYVGKIYATGSEFDANYDAPEPASVQLVSPGVIEGWAQGVPGMRVGGRRQLVIPPELGYGAGGQPPDIPANSTLVFVIDLVSIGGTPPG